MLSARELAAGSRKLRASLQSRRVASTSAAETFTADERARLAPYFTNLDGHVFALTNLPETVKGALFARYSRSAKSLRRLFLDEFADKVAEPDRQPARPEPRTSGRRRARREALRQGVQRVRRRLGRAAWRRAHRLRVRLERPDQAARVGPPDGLPRAVHALRAVHRPAARPLAVSRPGRDPRRRAARSLHAHDGCGVRVLREVDRADAGALRARAIPKTPPTPTPSTASAIRAKALDTLRGMLPAATQSNLGIYGTGQAFEALLLRLRASPLAEARDCAGADADRAAEGHPRVSRARRPAGSRRDVERVPRRHAARDGGARGDAPRRQRAGAADPRSR